jgi:hypothetical protein
MDQEGLLAFDEMYNDEEHVQYASVVHQASTD